MFTIEGPTEKVRILTLNIRSLKKHLAGVSLAINFPKELNQTFHRDTNISLKKENKAWTAFTREKRVED